MSEFPVLDEFGSDSSNVVESIQTEAQGEFGVTCRARMCEANKRTKSKADRRAAMMGCVGSDTIWKYR